LIVMDAIAVKGAAKLMARNPMLASKSIPKCFALKMKYAMLMSPIGIMRIRRTRG